MPKTKPFAFLLLVFCFLPIQNTFAEPDDGQPCIPKEDLMKLLPTDLLRIIYKDLNVDSKKNLSAVSKRHRELMLNEFLKTKEIDLSLFQVGVELTGEQIENYLNTIPNSVAAKIENLKLEGQKNVNDEVLSRIFKRFPNLKDLNIYDTGVNGTAFSHPGVPALTHLKWDMPAEGRDAMEDYIRNSKTLQSYKIWTRGEAIPLSAFVKDPANPKRPYNTSVKSLGGAWGHEPALVDLIKTHPNLRELEMVKSGPSLDYTNALRALIPNQDGTTPKLESLRFLWLSDQEQSVLAQVVNTNSKLKALDFNTRPRMNRPLTAELIEALRKSPDIKSLKLTPDSVSTLNAAMQNAPVESPNRLSLTHLIIPEDSNEVPSLIARFPKLESLDVSTGATPELIAALKMLPNIKKLTLSGIKNSDDLPKNLAQILDEHPHIENLDLVGAIPKREDLSPFIEKLASAKLKRLKLQIPIPIDQTIQLIKKNQSLQELIISSSYFYHDGQEEKRIAEALKNNKNINRVIFTQTPPNLNELREIAPNVTIKGP